MKSTVRFLLAVLTLLGCTAVRAEDNGQGMVCPYIRSVESKTSVDTSGNYREISGLAISPTQLSDGGNPIFFAVSDKGNGARLGVYDSGTGERLLSLRIKNQYNIDWESLAIGPCGDRIFKTCIYIADIGSNTSRDSGGDRDGRDDKPYRIIKILEPIWTEHSDGDRIEAEDKLLFDYKDESSPTPYADCEAMFVDHKGWGDGNAQGDIYLATKWDSTSDEKNRLFKIPAKAWDEASSGFVHSPKAIGEYSTDGSSDFMDHTWTSADMSLDGTLIALGTTRETHIFLRCPGESVESVLARPKSKNCRVWSNPTSGQGEAFAFMPDGKSSLGIPEGDQINMGITFFGYDVGKSNRVCEQSSTLEAASTAAPSEAPTSDPSGTPTETPVSAPTAIPTAAPSYGPIAIPSQIPSTSPTKSPTSEPTTTPSIQSELKIRVSPVTGDLVTTFEVAKGFESACSKFFGMHFQNTIREVNCVLVKQALTLPRGGRNLQHQQRSLWLDEMILDSTVLVSGIPAADGYFQEDFEAALAPLLNENSDDFATLLKIWTYFSKVDTIEGYDSAQEFPDPNAVAAPTPSPMTTGRVPAKNHGDKIIKDTNNGIIVLLVVAGFLVALLLCYMKKRSPKKELPPPRESPIIS